MCVMLVLNLFGYQLHVSVTCISFTNDVKKPGIFMKILLRSGINIITLTYTVPCSQQVKN